MKVISAFFKLVGLLLMIIFVISMPIMLLSRNLGRTLDSPAGLLELVQENVFDEDTLASVAEEVIKNGATFNENGEENSFNTLLQIGISNLSHDDWVTLTNLVLPPDFISQTFDQIIEGYNLWLEGISPIPNFRIDLVPWKNNILFNAVPIFDLIMRNFPPCNPGQIDDYRYIQYSGEFVDVPQCRPPEPLYSEIIEAGATEVPGFVGNYPDYLDYSPQLREVGRDWGDIRKNLIGMIDVMRSGWIFIIFLFVIAIPMGARSVHGLFTWVGWPLLLAGVGGLLIALLLLFFTDSIFVTLGIQIPVELPREIFPSIKAVIFGFIHYFARPLLVQSAIMIGLGVMVILGGVLIHRFKENRDWPSSDYSSRLQSFGEPDKQTKQPQPGSPPKIQKSGRKDEEEDTPTGMFG